MTLEISLACTSNAHTDPILNGTVRPESIRFHATAVYPSELFWRQLKFAEFDVSEMSLSSLFILNANGNRDWVGVPVFATRRFYHTGMLVRTTSDIRTPGQLRGKKVGVPEYQQTAALWGRGVLQHEFGVHAREIEWYMERSPAKSHGGATGFKPPEGVRLRYIDPDQTIGGMLLSGELDAALHYTGTTNLVDRTRVDIRRSGGVRTLFPDPVQEGIRYYRKTGIYPINHTLIVRRALAEKHPWIVLNIYNAFLAAKEARRTQLREFVATYEQLGLLPSDGKTGFDVDPFEYGIRKNRGVLDTLAQYSHEQGLTSRRVSPEDVFAPQTLEL